MNTAGIVCEHGSLRRKCVVCELIEAEAEIAHTRDALRLVSVLANNPIINRTWKEVPDSEVDAWVERIKELKHATE